jgi:CheY-like chemotaxis protein
MQLSSLRATASSTRDAIDPRWLDQQLAIATRAAARLTSLCEALIEVSRSTVGGFELKREDVDLSRLVRDVVERTSPELKRARCEVKVTADDTVSGDWDRLALERVISQLLSNAMKYGAHGAIDISVRAVDGDAAELTVRDHGIGISPEDRARIFERFGRGGSIEHYGGFGVGLWLVRRLVEAHGGEVAVTDAPGGGAQFVVRLPRHAPAPASKPKRGTQMDGAKVRVLVVDDDDDVREIMQMGLGTAGYETSGAMNGADALEALQREVPDVVLLDMMMPVMNGPQLLAALRADERYRDLPVIMVTAWPGEASALQGAQEVLSKPVDLGQLVRTIDRAVH